MYTLQQVHEFTGIPKDTIKTKRKRKKITGYFLNGEWLYTQADVDTLVGRDDYEELSAAWVIAMETGTLGKVPFEPKHVESMEYHLEYFWKLLNKSKALNNLTPENLENVLATFRPNKKTQQDYYSTKRLIYNAVMSFSKYLVKRKLWNVLQREGFKECKPKEKYSKKRMALNPADLEEAIIFNKSHLIGRSEFAMMQSHVLLHLYGYGGLRRMEAAWLTPECVFLEKNALLVHGKNGKDRIVPMCPELKQAVIDWSKFIVKGAKWLVHQEDGKQLTETSINTRFFRLSKALGKPIRTHDSRRGAATYYALAGMPIPVVKSFLGHSKIETTMLYIRDEEKDLFDWFDSKYGVVEKLTKPNKKKSKSLF